MPIRMTEKEFEAKFGKKVEPKQQEQPTPYDPTWYRQKMAQIKDDDINNIIKLQRQAKILKAQVEREKIRQKYAKRPWWKFW